MKSLSEITAELIIEDYIDDEHNRIFIPGLTDTFSKDLQFNLSKKNCNVYLTRNNEVNESKNWIHTSALTSIREESPIIIFSPSDLQFAQEGIRSVGGTGDIIWDEGFPLTEPDSVLFKKLLKSIHYNLKIEDSENAIKCLLKNGIFKSLYEYDESESTKLIIHEVLDNFIINKTDIDETFRSDTHEEVCDFKKFCYSLHFPYSEKKFEEKNNTEDVKNYISQLSELFKQFDETLSQPRNFVINILKSRITNSDLSENEKSIFLENIEALISANNEGFGLFRYRQSFKKLKSEIVWKTFSLENLNKVLNVPEKKHNLDLYIENIEILGLGEKNSGNNVIICTKDSKLKLFLKYDTNIPLEDLNKGALKISSNSNGIFMSKDEINYTCTAQKQMDSALEFEIPLNNETDSFHSQQTIEICFLLDEGKGFKPVGKKSNFKIFVAHEDIHNTVAVFHSQNVKDFYATHISPKSEDEPADKLPRPFHDDISISLICDKEDRNVELKYSGEKLITETKKGSHDDTKYFLSEEHRIKNEVSISNVLEITTLNGTYLLEIEFQDSPKLEFSFEDQMFKSFRDIVKYPSSANSHKNTLRLIKATIEGSRDHKTNAYTRLGKFNEVSTTIIRISKAMECPNTGHLPFAFNNNFEIKSSSKRLINIDDDDISTLPRHLDVNNLSDPGTKLLSEYKECRNSLLSFIKDKYSNYSRKFPIYCQVPYFIACYSDEIKLLIKNYLSVYLNILDFLNSAEPNEADKKVLYNLDRVISTSSELNKPILIGPYHPIQIFNKFLIQKNIYFFTSYYLENPNKKESFLGSVDLLRSNFKDETIHSFEFKNSTIGPEVIARTNLCSWLATNDLNDFSLAALKDKLGKIDLNLKLRDTYEINYPKLLKNYRDTYPFKNSLIVKMPETTPLDVARIEELLESSEIDEAQQCHFIHNNLEIEDSAFNSEIIFKEKGERLFLYENDWDKKSKVDIEICSKDKNKCLRRYDDHNRLKLNFGTSSTAIYSATNKDIKTNAEDISTTVCLYPSKNEFIESDTIESIYQEIRIKNSEKCTIDADECLPIHSTLSHRWLYVPHTDLDVSSILSYVKKEGNVSLWDYKRDIWKKDSYFILSENTQSIKSHIEKYISPANEILQKLSESGISISSDVMKTTNSCKGSIGLANAFQGLEDSGLLNKDFYADRIDFIISVDSFKTLFAKYDDNISRKFCDLIGFSLRIKDETLEIHTVCIEAKFRSSNLESKDLKEISEQLKGTQGIIKKLIENSIDKSESGIPERLGLLELITFGLRTKYKDSSEFLELEGLVHKLILSGRYHLKETDMTSLLFVFIPDFSNDDSCKPLKGNGIDCIIKYNSTNNPFTKTGTYNQYKNLSSFLEFSNQDNQITTSESPHQNSSNGDSENINSDEEVSALESYDENELPNNFINNSQLSRQTKTSESFDQIPDTFIGRYQASGVPVKLNISSCDDRNAIICGSSGKGKSSLLKYLIYKYVKYHESCFVFDVVNSDFSNEKILIEQNNLSYIDAEAKGLPFNPLIPSEKIKDGRITFDVKKHISSVVSIISYGCGFEDKQTLKRIFRDAIRQSFQENNIPIENDLQIDFDTQEFPSFPRVIEIIEGQNGSNVDHLISRLTEIDDDGILENAKGSFKDLLHGKYLINLSKLSSDRSKKLAICLFLKFAETYFTNLPVTNQCKHCIIIDEAKRLQGFEVLDRYALECRKWGVSLLLSSQTLTHFSNEIINNSSTKICHKITTGTENRKMIDLLGSSNLEAQELLSKVDNFDAFEVLINSKNIHLEPIYTLGLHHYLIFEYLLKNGVMKIDQLNQIDGYDPPDSRKLRNDLNVLIKLEAIKENIADNTVEAIEGALS